MAAQFIHNNAVVAFNVESKDNMDAIVSALAVKGGIVEVLKTQASPTKRPILKLAPLVPDNRSRSSFIPVITVPAPVAKSTFEDYVNNEYSDNEYSDEEYFEPVYDSHDESEYSDDEPYNQQDNKSHKSCEPKFVPLPVRKLSIQKPALPWSVENTAKITNELKNLPVNEEDSIIMDDVEFFTGAETKFTVSPLVGVSETPEPRRHDLLMEFKSKIKNVYIKDSEPIKNYILKVTSEIPVQTTVKPQPSLKKTPTRNISEKRTKPSVKKTNIYDSLNNESSDDDEQSKTATTAMESLDTSELSILSTVDPSIKLPELYSDVSSDSESDNDQAEKIIEPVETVEEREAREALQKSVLKRLETRAVAERKRAAEQKSRAQREPKPATPKSQEAVTRRKEKSILRARSQKLKLELFSGKATMARATVSDPARLILQRILNPTLVNALNCKLLMQMPDEIIKCTNDKKHMIPLPPFADDDVFVASPTQANVIHTPIIPAPLCRAGIECGWYIKQAYEALGMETPYKYQNATPCYYMHLGAEMLDIKGTKFAQCSLIGCTAEEHYTPQNDESVVVLHMQVFNEMCSHDRRNFCLNILGDGCCRRHKYAGPLMVSMIMRNALAHREADPYKWPITDNGYLFKISREIMEAKVPITGQNDTLEKRLAVKGNWPPQPAREKPYRATPNKDGKPRRKNGK